MAKLIMCLYGDSSPIFIYHHSHNALEEVATKSLHNLKITKPHSFRWGLHVKGSFFAYSEI